MNKNIFDKALSNLKTNETCWLLTVVHADGSTPGRLGMKMLVKGTGELLGTIGGGNIERVTVDRVLQERPADPIIWNFDLDGDSDYEKTGMICGGTQTVFIDPLSSQFNLTIIGGGHCGEALSELATRCGFSVTVIDNREECATLHRHPFASHIICSPYSDVGQHIQFSKKTYIVIMTQGHKADDTVLRQVLGKEYCYLGVIGSRKKTATLLEGLIKDGFSRDEVTKIFSPIGLPIGSQTATEVAVSIAAQLIAVRKGMREIKFNSNPML